MSDSLDFDVDRGGDVDSSLLQSQKLRHLDAVSSLEVVEESIAAAIRGAARLARVE